MQQDTALRIFSTAPEDQLDAEVTARLIATASDVAIMLDRNGVVRDVSVSAAAIQRAGFEDIVSRRWIDTVTAECRGKVEEMLSEAREKLPGRWREINQIIPNGAIPLRYVAVPAGHDGRIIALGRDLRETEALQQRLLQAQQALERDYARLRQAETRYRVLFQTASEAVLIIDPASRKIVEANPAAGALLGEESRDLAGKPFERFVLPDQRERVAALLADVSGARSEPLTVRLMRDRRNCKLRVSGFRQDGTTHVLLSLEPDQGEASASLVEAKLRLLRVLNRIPDAFVVTDDALCILEVNLAFLELTQLPSAEAARGQKLSRFIGRPGADLKVLAQTLGEHGWARNFRTIVRTVFGDTEDVDLSAVALQEGLEATQGFVIRSARNTPAMAATSLHELPRTAEQMMQLVGRVSLRDIVAETTDVIERMCIEAALNLTGNNRASAAEILGVSRQSLYSKLTRHGVRNRSQDDRGPDNRNTEN